MLALDGHLAGQPTRAIARLLDWVAEGCEHLLANNRRLAP